MSIRHEEAVRLLAVRVADINDARLEQRLSRGQWAALLDEAQAECDRLGVTWDDLDRILAARG